MTSAAVSNITAPVTAAGSSAKDTNKVAEGADVTFQNLLQNPKQQNKSLTSQANVVTPQKADNAGGVKAAEKPYEAVSKREAVRIDDASKGSKAVLSEEEMAQAQEAVSTFAEEVKQVLEEELNVTVSVGEFLCSVEYDYPEFHLSMYCFFCYIENGEIVLLEHEAAKWLAVDELDTVKWLPADIEVLEKLHELFD